MSNLTPIRVTGTFTPSGTQDVNIISSVVLNIAASSLPLPTGAATETTLLEIEEDLDQFTFSSTRLLTDGSEVIQPISGSVSVSNFPAIQSVSQSGSWTVSLTSESIEIGTVDQGTGGASAWLVTGPLTDTQLRASPVPISGTITANAGTGTFLVDGSAHIQPISGTVTANLGTVDGLALDTTLTNGTQHTLIDNFPATVAVTQSTSPWVVSGSITTSPNVNVHDGTGTSISSTGSSLNVDVTNTVPVTGTFFQATQPISAASLPLPSNAAQETGGNLAAAKVDLDKFTFASTRLLVDGSGVIQPVSLTSTTITGTVAVTQSTSPWAVSGTVTTTPSGTQDENLTKVAGVTLGATGVTTYGTAPAAVNVPGVNAFITNTPAVTLASTTITGNVTVVQPTGTNLHTVLDSGTLTSITNALPAGTNVIGHVITDTGSTTVVTGSVAVTGPLTDTQLRATPVPVSGTVTANQGTSPWVDNITQLAGNAIDTNSGSKSAGTLRVVLATDQPQLTNALKVDGSAVTQPISATSLPLPTGASTAALQTQPGVDIGDVTINNASGASAVNIQDGGNSITVDNNGTFAVQAAQSGTWTVQPGNTPNTSPWLIEQRAPGTLTTYSAAVLGLAAAVTPTDIFTIYGSGTKTIKIIRIEISATENTAAVRDIVLIKRSATNTGGTSASVTAVSHDSNNAAATGTVLSYTANPAALGASVGNVRTGKLDVPATNLTGNTDRLIWTFGDRPGQAMVLRGTSQGVAVNLNSVTSASNSFDISVEWTEE